MAQKLYIHLTWHAVHAPYTPAPLSESIKPDDDAFSNYCPPPGTPPAAVSGGLERCNFGYTPSPISILSSGLCLEWQMVCKPRQDHSESRCPAVPSPI